MIKRLLITLFVLLLLQSTATANCIEIIPYGSPVSAIKARTEASRSLGKSSVRSDIFVPVEELCNGSELEILRGASVLYIFLFNKLVHINIYLLSDAPKLIDWVERFYGEAVKAKDFYSQPTAGKLVWDRPGKNIIYSIKPGKGEVSELLAIKSISHENLFNKFHNYMEKIQGAGGGLLLP